jgi:hypothetical protein
MIADRAYSPGLFASPDGRASLLYFAAAVPTVGFVHGAADLSPLNAAALEGYVDARFPNRATYMAAPGRGSAKPSHSSRRWSLWWLP